MVDTLARPDQPTDRRHGGPVRQGRGCGLLHRRVPRRLLVISSMVALNTALPDIATATSATQTELTWIVDSYTLVLACLLLPAGALGDRYGRRGALVVGLAIFARRVGRPGRSGRTRMYIIVARGVAGRALRSSCLRPCRCSPPPTRRISATRPLASGPVSQAAAPSLGMLGSGALLSLLVVAVHLLGIRRMRRCPSPY